jgi:hypothetical protein
MRTVMTFSVMTIAAGVLETIMSPPTNARKATAKM